MNFTKLNNLDSSLITFSPKFEATNKNKFPKRKKALVMGRHHSTRSHFNQEKGK